LWDGFAPSPSTWTFSEKAKLYIMTSISFCLVTTTSFGCRFRVRIVGVNIVEREQVSHRKSISRERSVGAARKALSQILPNFGTLRVVRVGRRACAGLRLAVGRRELVALWIDVGELQAGGREPNNSIVSCPHDQFHRRRRKKESVVGQERIREYCEEKEEGSRR